MEKVFQVEYAGHPVRYSFLNRGTKLYFRDYIRRAEDGGYDIRVTPELMDEGRKLLPEDSREAYVEYRLLIERTALELLQWDCCIFHSAAFVYRGYAWLLTAPSGVGKTTQFLNWQRLHPSEIEMICGDMPVLEPRADGTVTVHSTSWCGKENIGTRGLNAPLAGIVLLEQGRENRLTSLSPADAVMPFFKQFMARPETEEQIAALIRLMNALLRAAPVWKLENLGDGASTEMIRGTFSARADEITGGSNGKV